jgi:hypothetical protein
VILIAVEKNICTKQLLGVGCNEYMLFNVWCCTYISEKDVMVLQYCTNSENILEGPCGESYTTSHNANQARNIKVKEGSAAEEKEDPVPITFPEIKAEPEVSSMCSIGQITQMCRSAGCLLISLSVYACETTPLC